MTLDIINHLINISDIRHKTLSITPGPILVQGKKLRFFFLMIVYLFFKNSFDILRVGLHYLEKLTCLDSLLFDSPVKQDKWVIIFALK